MLIFDKLSTYESNENSFDRRGNALPIQAADSSKWRQWNRGESSLESSWSLWEGWHIGVVLAELEVSAADEVEMRHKHVFGRALINCFIFAGLLALKPAS